MFDETLSLFPLVWEILLIVNVSPGSLSVSFESKPLPVFETVLEDPSVAVAVSAVAAGASFWLVIEIVKVVVSVSLPSVTV